MVKEYANLSLLLVEELKNGQTQMAAYKGGLTNNEMFVIKHADMYWFVYDDHGNLILKVADYINGRSLLMMFMAVTC